MKRLLHTRTPRASASASLTAALSSDARTVRAPRRTSFAQFLTCDAKVPGDSSRTETRGTFSPFTFAGREALVGIVETVDEILGNRTGKPIEDAQIDLAGGAQFGKTVLQHACMAYATGQLFRSTLMFLPDGGLVNDMVQTKFRPNVVDQLPWFADMLRLGVVVNNSGRTLHRIGAFQVTDGVRRCNGMFAALGKVPTSVSGDIALLDELDDIPEKNMNYVGGRLGASDLRFTFRIGTQRVHGRGMNKAWREGSQGVVEWVCPKCKRANNPEESFPGIVCLREERPSKGKAPARLTYAGDFRRGEEIVAPFATGQTYFVGCISCGTELDRSTPVWRHRKPDRIALSRWSFRISQLSIGAIELPKIVRQWSEAIENPDKMVVFRCDVLGLPKSTAQKLEPDTIERARNIEVYDIAPPVTAAPRYAGLDMGQRCWFTARETRSRMDKRIIWAESVALHAVSARVPELMRLLQISCITIDQMPETRESRALALAINGLSAIPIWPRIPATGQCTLIFPGGLRFTRDAKGNESWTGCKAAVVRFDKKKPGQGIEWGIDIFEGPAGTDIAVPLINCNRQEFVDGVVAEFLTPKEGVMEVIAGHGVREIPAIRLPRIPAGGAEVWEQFETHHVAGSEREKDEIGQMGDYVDGIANHFLFSNGYSRLAEVMGGRSVRVPFAYARVQKPVQRRHGV